MKVKYLPFVLVSLLVLGTGACQKEHRAVEPAEQEGPTLPTSIFDLKVSALFNFESTRDLSLRVGIENGKYPDDAYRINLYTDFPDAANLISSGIVMEGDELGFNLRVPTALQNIHIEKVSPTGETEFQRLKAANNLVATFRGEQTLLMLKEQSKQDKPVSQFTGKANIDDLDNDGVPDNIDDYPNDADRAYNSYYPDAGTYSTLGFEDLWPSQGDFDFNDMVISYQVKKVLNGSNEVVEMYTTCLVRAIGATYENGFGFQLDELSPSDIAVVSGQRLTKSLITLNSNQTESGQTKAVIMVFDSPEPVINRVGGSMFNTVKTNGSGTFDTLSLYIGFTSPVAESKLTMTAINPFIFVDGQRGIEIHLPDRLPTDKANTQLFGTKNDRSNAGQGRYYKTENNLPFAIEVPVIFDYPVEKEAISDAYTHFISWATSGGTNYTNWYENLSGFRNTSKIY